MSQVHRVIFRLSIYLLVLFIAESVFGQQPISNKNQKIEACLKSKKCVFQLRGEATANPVMSFIVAKEVWASFGEKEKDDLRTLLKEKMEQAKTKPELYTDIPASAPFYQKALSNIRNTRSYSIILSNSQGAGGALSVDNEILVDF
jgi:hypothetical protein